jgi:hypothetical protein
MRTVGSWVVAASLAACSSEGGGRDEGTGTAPTGPDPVTTTPLPTTGGETTATATGEVGEDSGTDTSSGGGTKLDVGGVLDLGDGMTTGECAAQSLAPETKSIGVDIVVVVDTSASMASAVAAVEQSINVDFAQILEASAVDYRIVVLGDYPPGGQLTICISAPLSGTDCNPPPPVPAVTERYKHYDALTGSGAFLANILAWYSTPDPHGLAPGGYRDFLRDGTRKVILAMTDGSSASGDPELGDAFDTELLALQPPHFGTPGDRAYVFHTIITMDPNDPPSTPWLPPDPIQGEGGSIQQVSVRTGGWRFPLAQVDDFDVLFQEIAKEVVEQTPIACDFPIPTPDMGTIDPNTIEIDYTPGVGPQKPFHQVVDLAACEPDAFYIADGTVFLCPEACAEVQADPQAALDVRYGCDVGFDPSR